MSDIVQSESLFSSKIWKDLWPIFDNLSLISSFKVASATFGTTKISFSFLIRSIWLAKFSLWLVSVKSKNDILTPSLRGSKSSLDHGDGTLLNKCCGLCNVIWISQGKVDSRLRTFNVYNSIQKTKKLTKLLKKQQNQFLNFYLIFNFRPTSCRCFWKITANSISPNVKKHVVQKCAHSQG